MHVGSHEGNAPETSRVLRTSPCGSSGGMSVLCIAALESSSATSAEDMKDSFISCIFMFSLV